MSGLGFTCWSALVTIAFGVSFCTIDYAIAQITPDGTLPNNTSVTQDGKTFDITGGTQVGGNLFHSFKEFSLRTGDTASFNNIAAIENIFSRVTGKSVSNIDGLIRANGRANLFLINPNGIIFGPNASLNINGSFVGTTANAIGLTNGDIFSTNPLGSIPTRLLNINPSAFFFNQIAAPITVKSRRDVGLGLSVLYSDPNNLKPIYEGLKVPNGQSLLLVGGDVNLDGGVLQAPGGQVELGGALGFGKIDMSVDSNNLRLSFPNDTARANVSLTNEALVDVIAGDGGSITINARNLDIFKSSLTAGIAKGLGTVDSQAGDITLNTTEAMRIGQTDPIRTTVINKVDFGTTGNTGNINIKAGSSVVIDSAALNILNYGQGDAGSISVQANQSSHFANTFISISSAEQGESKNISVQVNGAVSFVDSYISTSAIGQGNTGGNILVEAKGDISLNDETFIDSSSPIVLRGNNNNLFLQGNNNDFGQGNSGNISVHSNGNISFTDYSTIQSYTSGQGNAGNISIQADKNISFLSSSSIQSYTTEDGDAGNVSIHANGNVSFLNNTSIESYTTGRSEVETGAVGNGGNISINSGSFILQDGAKLVASTFGQGNAGNVTVQTRDAVSLADNVYILSTVEPGGDGKGGNIDINAATLSLIDGARLQTSTRGASASQSAGQGNAGNINVNVTGAIDIAGKKNGFVSAIDSRVGTGAVGNGGNISINSGSFTLQDGAEIVASTFGQGNAGNVTVQTRDAVSLADNAYIFSTVEPGGVGKGGNIDINAATLSLINGGTLLTLTREASDTQPAGRGNAGNINVNVTGAIDIAGEKNGFVSAISSRVETGTVGNGGNITINSGSFSLLDGALLTAETLGQGNAGTIKVNAATQVNISGKSSNFNSGLFVNSQSPTGTAGDIIVTSPRITLDNSGTLNAQSALGNGGDINLQTDLLLLRRGAQISTTAGTAEVGGDGGNINIDLPSGFIVAVPGENSDIRANAFTGAGGRVNIKANGIYGIEFRESPTPLSDITASSEFGTQGTVELNTPGIDPNSGLVELPTVAVDTQIAQGCYSPGYAQNSFIITGRGGLPPNPREAFSSNIVRPEWATLSPSNDINFQQTIKENPPIPTLAAPIVEATGWGTNTKGEIVLTANASTGTPHKNWQQSPVTCSSAKSASN
ncbi:filamentous hemagglutinin N-terminal domain-containing protein [Nostoc sp. XA010]|uniref:two-partner secretion domain-containing protein n=1 Tax=Nostoc sp. XA010 TaxID=2780407 RepID=UPI001E360B3B|nr:filamentous hemagglutinin N-terminal domain-containing protein [Nostoc sp. XA010]MCC5661579.1 filamentous hemagglutinin N-terminal domain-containing protein [Nostoc sp. XA010]